MTYQEFDNGAMVFAGLLLGLLVLFPFVIIILGYLQDWINPPTKESTRQLLKKYPKGDYFYRGGKR